MLDVNSTCDHLHLLRTSDWLADFCWISSCIVIKSPCVCVKLSSFDPLNRYARKEHPIRMILFLFLFRQGLPWGKYGLGIQDHLKSFKGSK